MQLDIFSKDLDSKKKEFVYYARLIYKKGFVVAYEGNLSIRLNENYILVTPSKFCKGKLQTKDLVIVDKEGNLVYSENSLQPTSEILMHLAVYKHRKDINAVIHSHPPYSIALTLSGISLEEPDLPEILLVLGSVPTAKYALTGTQEMVEAILPYISYNSILLSHHGVLSLGENLEEAYYRLEEVEHCAKILCIAHQIGNIQTLPSYRKIEIKELQKKYLRKD
ncbi:MAG: class II aldolase/adducin family protein [Leptonema sp. (in: bacteria)]